VVKVKMWRKSSMVAAIRSAIPAAAVTVYSRRSTVE